MAVVDDISPIDYGEDLIRLTLSQTTQTPRAFAAVVIDVDFSDTLPDGVVLPLEVSIVPPTKANAERRIVRKVKPSTIVFKAKEGGSHLVTIREIGHNLWTGLLVVDVAGERLART